MAKFLIYGQEIIVPYLVYKGIKKTTPYYQRRVPLPLVARFGRQVIKQKLDKKEKLSSLTGWTLDPTQDAWLEGVSKIADFVKEHGNAKVPHDFKTVDGFKLGAWIRNRRSTKGNLSPEQVAQLEAFPEWSWNTNESKWNDAFEQLKQYEVDNGNTTIKRSYATNDGLKLGQWVAWQRYDRSNLSEDRKARLESLPGWLWNID